MGTTVSHNEMYDAPHLAILYTGNNHVIEYNELYRVCRLTTDGGASYAGRSLVARGNVIRQNYLHDIKGEAGGDPVAVYFDDALCGQTVTENIFENIAGTALLIGGGRDIIVKNNLFLDCGTAIVYDERARSGFLRNDWFSAHLGEGNELLGSLHAVPYTNEAWRTAYPELAAISTDESQPNAPEFYCNPTGSVIENNALCYTGSEQPKTMISNSVFKYSTYQNNLACDMNSEAFKTVFAAKAVKGLTELFAAGAEGLTPFTISYDGIGRQ